MALPTLTCEGAVAPVEPEQAPVLARPFYAAGPPGPLVASATAMLARYCTALELPSGATTLAPLEHEGFAT